MFLWNFCIILVIWTKFCNSKYLEGHLKTLDDWAFVARFCFISGRGRYEYEIEFDRRLGEPELLLYYDDKSQWPAVYKTGKTCLQKLSVLSRDDNQIVTLSVREPLSGCIFKVDDSGMSTATHPTPNSSGAEGGGGGGRTPNPKDDSTYFDQFLKTTPTSSSSSSNDTSSTTEGYFDDNVTLINDSETNNLTSRESNIMYSFDTGFGYRNQMENNTNYQLDVEELFDKMYDGRNGSRLPRSILSPEKRVRYIVSCHNIGGFTSSRERWWYIAISNCGSQKGIDIKYKFRMTNGAPGDFWNEHFSADEMYIPPILFTMCISYAFLLLATFLCAVELKTRHLFHCTYRLFTFSAFIQWIGILAEGAAWTKYAISGLGPYRYLGGFFMGASEVSFLLLMLLMAKGYTITRARLSSCTTIKLSVFINMYIVSFIWLYIYQAMAFDPGEVLNLYESPAGFGLIGLRIGAWCTFLISIGSTLKKYPEKGAFYYPFGMLGSLWLLGGPIMILIGIGVLDAWVRESVMYGAISFITLGGHAAFLWLTWPSRANKSFPYHVRTNHVGIATDDDGLDYPRHPYAPSAPDPNVVIPISRQTEDLLSGVYNQYMRERDMYNSASTPLSHISFPPQTASVPNLSDVNEFNPNGSDEIHSYQEMTEETRIVDNTPSTSSQTEDKIQIDSGHPSLDNSPSVSENNEQTITVQQGEIQPQKTVLKNNPFLVNGASRGPNKVILDPIEYPLRKTSGASIGNGVPSVPKHLFTAKSNQQVT